MKFIVSREQLLVPLQQIVSVIEKRQTMPILANVLIKAIDNKLILTGTDLEIQLIVQVQVDIAEEGEITVPARKFLDICRLLPNDSSIDFVLQDDKVKIKSGRSRFSLSSLVASDYPEFVETEMEGEFQVDAVLLKKALDKTVFCMASQDVRYYLNGLMMNLSNSRLKLVASDGHRLAIYENDIGQDTGYESRILVPKKGVQELSRLLDKSDEQVNIKFSKNTIRFQTKKMTLSAKLVDANYPDFNKVFQQEFFSAISIPRQSLKAALTRVAILANEKFKGVSLEITAGQLKISAHNPEHEEAEEELSLDYQGDSVTIAFNAQYILDAIANLDSDNAQLIIARNASSCFIEEPQSPEQSLEYRFIVMPMRL